MLVKSQILFFFFIFSNFLFSHPFQTTKAKVFFEDNSICKISLKIDISEYLQKFPSEISPMRPFFSEEIPTEVSFLEAKSAIQEIQKELERNFQILDDRKKFLPMRIILLSEEEILKHAERAIEESTNLILSLQIESKTPREAKTLFFRFPLNIGMIHFSSDLESSILIQAGKKSRPFSLQEQKFIHSSSFQILKEYVYFGFTHVLPLGMDHLLFIFGIFLLGKRFLTLIKQATVFTLAHTLTLGLSAYGVIYLSASIVEPLIALSIAFVATENLFIKKLSKQRIFIIFFFGLLHGMGFASSIREIGLPQKNFSSALLGFNIGVEIAQIAILCLAYLLFLPFKNKSCQVLKMIFSLIILLISLYWTLERVSLYFF